MNDPLKPSLKALEKEISLFRLVEVQTNDVSMLLERFRTQEWKDERKSDPIASH